MPAKELYQLASRLEKAGLWDLLFDSEIFAVRMADGQTGYCRAAGLPGEELSFAVYLGNEGLDSFRRLALAEEEGSNTQMFESTMLQNCVMCTFRSKADLQERELAEIEGYKLKSRGKIVYPTFQRCRARYYPWYLNDAKDEAYMMQGLKAALEVAECLKREDGQQDMFHNPDKEITRESLGFTENTEPGVMIPLLTEKENLQYEWGSIRLPEPVETTVLSPQLTDELALARLKKQKKRIKWECALFLFPKALALEESDSSPVKEKESVPWFPYALAMVNHANGMIYHVSIAYRMAGYEDELIKELVDTMMEQGMPNEILVRDARTRALLSDIAGQAGIKLTREEDLPYLEEAMEQLSSTRGELGEEDLDGILDELLKAGDTRQLPDELTAQLANVEANEDMPGALRQKIRKILGKIDNEGTQKKLAHVRQDKAEESPGKSFIISVTLEKGCFRHIRISSDATLNSLHEAIQRAFGFDDDHLYGFFMDNKMWSRMNSYYSRYAEEADRCADDYKLGELGLFAGMQFKYLFDFGDMWRFQCKVLKALETPADEAAVVRSAGTAPSQYGDEEE